MVQKKSKAGIVAISLFCVGACYGDSSEHTDAEAIMPPSALSGTCGADEAVSLARGVFEQSGTTLALNVSELLGPNVPFDRSQFPSLNGVEDGELLLQFPTLEESQVPPDCLQEDREVSQEFAAAFNTEMLRLHFDKEDSKLR